jgi:hypothetical protein
MHFRFLFTFNKEEAKNSEEARRFAERYLRDNGFVSSDKRWGSGSCDGFVIGGRWSGELTQAHLNRKKLNAFIGEFEEKYGWYVGGKERVTEEKRARQANKLFRKYFPEFGPAPIPFWRDRYREFGYEDDAMIVDTDIYERLLKAHKGETDNEDFADCQSDGVSPRMIGKKWVVLIDYHV